MLEKNIFGSTLSLGALLNESLFSDGEGDQFLQEMGAQTSRGPGEPAACEAHSGTSSFQSSLSGLGTTEDLASPSTCRETEAFPPLFPSLNSTSQQGPAPVALMPGTEATHAVQQPEAKHAENTRQGLAILGQLFAVLSGTTPASTPPPQQAPVQQPHESASGRFAAAFKTAAPAVEQYTIVPQETPTAQPYAANAKLPNLNAQQQDALQTLMNLGELGSTKEGKKVKRMLSNRESARRSRHRKQEHVLQVEEKAARLEAEVENLRAALSRAAEEQMRSVEESTRLYAEIAGLRNKIHQLEHAEQSKASHAATTNKRVASHSGAQGTASSDSCCDSLPAKRARMTDKHACGTACRNCQPIGC